MAGDICSVPRGHCSLEAAGASAVAAGAGGGGGAGVRQVPPAYSANCKW